MKKLITICVIAILAFTTNCIASDYWGVHLWQWKDSEGIISYEFNPYASFSGIVATPLSEILPIGIKVEEPTLSELIAQFPDGTYTFDDGIGGTYSAELDCPFPSQFPNITSTTFEPNGDLIITWDLWEIGKSNPVIDISAEDPEDYTQIYYARIDASSTQHTIPALLLPPLPLVVRVEFKNMTVVEGGRTNGDKINSTEVEVIPEPATICLLAIGSLGLIGRKK